MAGVRLVPKHVVDSHARQLRAAVLAAWEDQLIRIHVTLRANGIVLHSLTAAGKAGGAAAAKHTSVPALWSQDAWVRSLDTHLAPVATDVALAAVQAAVKTLKAERALWGLTHNADKTAAAVVARATSSGAWIGQRLDRAGVQGTGHALTAADVKLGSPTEGTAGVDTTIMGVLATAPDILGDTIGAMANTIATMGSEDVTSYLASAVTSIDAEPYLSATKSWNNVGDDKVRDTHQDVNDVAINEYFDVGGGMIGPGDPDGPDEEVINCRCVGPDTPVSAAVLAAARRPFDGQLLRLTTARGHCLTATPDHRILTYRGWVELGRLRPGDNLWRDSSHEPVGRRDPDEQHVVPSVEQVFDALVLAAGGAQRVCRLTVDLDGAPSDEQIDVVGTDDGLPLYFDAQGTEPLVQLALADPHREVGLACHLAPGTGFGEAQGVRSRDASRLDVGSQQPEADGRSGDPELLRYELLGSALRVEPDHRLVVHAHFAWRTLSCDLQPLGIADRADRDAGPTQVLVDGVRVAPQPPGDGGCRFPTLIGRDEVASIELVEHHGFVYDLTCPGGWFMADGIVVHNCWLTYDGVVPEGSGYEGGNTDAADAGIPISAGEAYDPELANAAQAQRDATTYWQEFGAAMHDNPNAAFVNQYSVDQIVSQGMTPVMANNGQTGALVLDHGDGRVEATGLYNVDGKGQGLELLQQTMDENGVNYVEAMGDPLSNLYQQLGFEVKSADDFDAALAPKGWNIAKDNEPTYYSLALPGSSAADPTAGDAAGDLAKLDTTNDPVAAVQAMRDAQEATLTSAQSDALDQYEFNMAYQDNNALRSGTALEELPQSVQDSIAAIDSIFASTDTTTDGATLYRGIEARTGQSTKADESFTRTMLDAKPGDILTDPGFLSTSLNESEATRREGWAIEIHTADDTKAIAGSVREAELILPRDQAMVIDSIDTEAKTLTVHVAGEGEARAADTLSAVDDIEAKVAADPNYMPSDEELEAMIVERSTTMVDELAQQGFDWGAEWNDQSAALTAEQQSAIRQYQMGTNYVINPLLRDGPEGLDEEDIGVGASTVQRLDAAFAATPVTTNGLTLYRGIGDPTGEFDEAMQAAKVGQVLSDQGYLSTSIDPDVAKGFSTADDSWVMTILTSDQKVLIVGGATIDDEAELLLPRGEAMLIQAIDPATRTVTVRAT